MVQIFVAETDMQICRVATLQSHQIIRLYPELLT